MKITVLTNIYNEEYLLPFWLEHHKKIFDHGIVIDYNSTDASVEIVKRICPSWTIMTTRNKFFEAVEIDKEFMDIENSIDGYKIILNTTEFLVGADIKKHLTDMKNCYHPIQCLTAISTKEPMYPKNLKELFEGIDNVELHLRFMRALHSYNNGEYGVGRHNVTKNVTSYLPAYVIWFGFYPWNEHIIQRKLQIKNKVPDSDIKVGFGIHHLWTRHDMDLQRVKYLNNSVPVDDVDNLKSYLQCNN